MNALPQKDLELYLFGPTQIWLKGHLIHQFRSHKIRDLLIYLIIKAHPNSTPQPRQALASLLWSDYPDSVARTNLRNTLARLRKLLAPLLADNPDFWQANRDSVYLNFNPQSHYCDVHYLETALNTYRQHPHPDQALCPTCVEQLTQSVARYQGDFLSDADQKDASLFADWRLEQQEYFHRQILLACQALASFHLAQHNYTEAEDYLRRQLSLEPWLEHVHQDLMRTLTLKGQASLALAQYQSCQQILQRELGVEVSAATTELYHQIQAEMQATTSLSPQTPVTALAQPAATKLPLDTTPFFGRTTELHQLKTLLLTKKQRLISLVGLGGAGKTRLALTTAKNLTEHFPDGAYFVPLAGVNPETRAAETLLVSAIAEALNIQFYDTESPTNQLLKALQTKHLLLILDNFEHLLPKTDFILQLLTVTPQVYLLVTSRERLNLQAEYSLQLEGLPLPQTEPHSTNTLAALVSDSSALALFVERAERSPQGFELTWANLPDVLRICRFLEGLPLAIELAATWTRVMPCADIVQAMREDLDFLSTPHRDVAPRHRSMRAVFAYSWQLLTPAEQLLLSRLSIFRGEFSQDAALNVLETSPRALLTLVDKSLLQISKPLRYQMHELLRQFAAEKLSELTQQSAPSKTLDHLKSQYTRYYLNFLHRKNKALNEPQGKLALTEIQAEFNNVRQAWQWAVAQGDIDLMRQSLAGLTNFYYLRGLFEEGLQTLTAAIQGMKAAQPPQPRLMGHLYLKKAQLFGESTQLEAAIEAAQTALALGQAVDSQRLIAASHLWWGRALWRQGHYQAAKEHLQESLEHAKNRLPDLEALAWRTLSNIYFEHGDYGQDQFYATKALQSYRQQRNYREESITLNNLGHVLMALGDYTASQQHFEEVLTIQRELGSPLDEAMALEALGDLHYLLEDYALAQEYLQSALEIYKRANDREGIGYTFTHLGNVAFALQQLAQAKIWHTQAQSVRETTGQLHLMSQNESALAEIALQEGQLEVAMQYTESTLQRLEGKPCLLEAYLRCYHVLQAAQDERASQLLQTAYEHLHTQAQKISTTAERQRFLNNVPLHRQFLQLFKEHNMPLMLDEQA